MVEEYYGKRATMSVNRKPGLAKERRIDIVADITNGISIGVHNSNIDNTERAILERVFFVTIDGVVQRPPLPRPDAIKSRLKLFKNQFYKRCVVTTPLTGQQFVNGYQGRKHTVYQNALKSLVERPLSVRDSHIMAFVKAEKINLSAKQDPAPRIIQPRHPRYNLSVGIYIKKIEGLIYRIIDDIYEAPTLAKGKNAFELGELISWKWNQFVDPVAVGLDASRFDQHCSYDILKWEHSIYKLFFPGDKVLSELLSWQLSNKGRFYGPDGKITYRTAGCRMSGDMNTGLGNCLIMCALIYSYVNNRFRFQLINNGDDCVLFLEKRDLHFLTDIPSWFTTMGYTMVVEEPVYVLEKIVFCQTQPVFNGSSYVMVRNPNLAISRDLYCIQSMKHENSWKVQMQSLSDCGTALYGDMPIFNRFYRMLDVGYKKRIGYTENSGLFWLSRGVSPRDNPEPTPECRWSFWKAFDLIPDAQIAIEEYYTGVDLEYRPEPIVNLTPISELYITRDILSY